MSIYSWDFLLLESILLPFCFFGGAGWGEGWKQGEGLHLYQILDMSIFLSDEWVQVLENLISFLFSFFSMA